MDEADGPRGWLRRHPVTVALALALVAGWALVTASDRPWLEAAVRAGGLQPHRAAAGELFRLVTPVFLHAHLPHLLLNGLALVQLGALSEDFFGARRTLVAFVWCGIAGCLASALYTTTPYVVSIGASGGILGLAGLLLGTSWFGADGVASELDELLGRRLVSGVGATLLFGFALQLVSPAVDNWAHLGGLGCGLLLSQVWAEPGALAADPDPDDDDDDDEGGLELLPAEPPSEGVLDALTAATAAICLGAFGWAALAGDRALATFPLDTARIYAERASIALASPWPGANWETSEVLANMLDAYDDAGAAEEGLDVFGRAVDRIDEGVVAFWTAGALDRSAGTGRDRDRAQIRLGERWLAISPDDPSALNDLAWNLVIARDPSLRDPARAEALAREALARIPPPAEGCAASLDAGPALRAGVLDTHAEALFQLGRLDEAAAAQDEAVDAARALGLEDVLPELELRQRKIARARSRG